MLRDWGGRRSPRGGRMPVAVLVVAVASRNPSLPPRGLWSLRLPTPSLPSSPLPLAPGSPGSTLLPPLPLPPRPLPWPPFGLVLPRRTLRMPPLASLRLGPPQRPSQGPLCRMPGGVPGERLPLGLPGHLTQRRQRLGAPPARSRRRGAPVEEQDDGGLARQLLAQLGRQLLAQHLGPRRHTQNAHGETQWGPASTPGAHRRDTVRTKARYKDYRLKGKTKQRSLWKIPALQRWGGCMPFRNPPRVVHPGQAAVRALKLTSFTRGLGSPPAQRWSCSHTGLSCCSCCCCCSDCCCC